MNDKRTLFFVRRYLFFGRTLNYQGFFPLRIGGLTPKKETNILLPSYWIIMFGITVDML